MAQDSPNEAALATYLYPDACTAHLSTNGEIGQGLGEVYVTPYSLPIQRIAEPE